MVRQHYVSVSILRDEEFSPRVWASYSRSDRLGDAVVHVDLVQGPLVTKYHWAVGSRTRRTERGGGTKYEIRDGLGSKEYWGREGGRVPHFRCENYTGGRETSDRSEGKSEKIVVHLGGEVSFEGHQKPESLGHSKDEKKGETLDSNLGRPRPFGEDWRYCVVL